MKHLLFIIGVFITVISFSQEVQKHRLFIIKSSSPDSLVLQFTFAEYSRLEFIQDDKVVLSKDFVGTKKYNFRRLANYDYVRFCGQKDVFTVYLLSKKFNDRFHCDGDYKETLLRPKHLPQI